MDKFMRIYCWLFAASVLIVVSCNERSSKTACRLDLTDAVDAFDYPLNASAEDSVFLAPQLRNIYPREDSFRNSFSAPFIQKGFQEPNLGASYSGEDCFRLTHDGGYHVMPVSIRVNVHEIIVKQWVKGQLYPDYDAEKLDPEEQWKFTYMERNFFSDRSKFKPWKKKFYDSVVLAMPELESLQYYLQLWNKQASIGDTFVFSQKVIPLTAKQYCKLIGELRETEFYRLPWQVKSQESVTHINGYVFEAHTAEKYKLLLCQIDGEHPLKITAFCRQLLKMAGIDDKKVLW